MRRRCVASGGGGRRWVGGRAGRGGKLRTLTEDGRSVAWPEQPRSEEEERKGAGEVKKLLEATQPRWAEVDEVTATWFLRDRRYDVKKAAGKLRRMLEWRERLGGGWGKQFPWEQVEPEAQTGKAYVHDTTDRFGRPVIVVDVGKHVTGDWPIESSERLTGYFLDECVAKLDGDEAVILGIMDLRDFRARNADIGYAKFLVDVFFSFYPRRLGRVLLVDAPLIFQPPWQVVKPLLGKYAKLVKFISSKELDSYFDSREDLPKTFR